MMTPFSPRALIAAGALAMTACSAAGGRTPATLERVDAETMAQLEATIARAMGRTHVRIAGDPTTSPTVAVPPRPIGPLEDLSTALPTPFDIMKEGSRCFIVRRDTGEEFDLESVSCRAVKD